MLSATKHWKLVLIPAMHGPLHATVPREILGIKKTFSILQNDSLQDNITSIYVDTFKATQTLDTVLSAEISILASMSWFKLSIKEEIHKLCLEIGGSLRYM